MSWRTAVSELSTAARVALVAQAVVNGSTTMVIPFLAIYLDRQPSHSAAATGTVLTVYVVAVRLMPAVTGVMGDHLGTRAMVVLGCLLRAAGLLAVPALDSWPLLAAAAAIIGLGGAFAEPALKATLAAEPASARTSAFAIRNQALNGSFVVGAALGGSLATVNLVVPFYLSAACLLVLAAVMLAALPRRLHVPAGPMRRYRTVLGNPTFMLFWLVLIPWWVLYSQLNVAFPLYAFRLSAGSEAQVGLLFIVSGICGVLVMWPVARAYRAWSGLTGLLAGMALLVASFAAMPVVASYWWFLVCVVVFTVAETLVLVGSDLFVSTFTTPRTSASFYGVYATSWAVGGSAGNYIGTWSATVPDAWMAWLPFAAIGVVGFIGVWAVRARTRTARAGRTAGAG